jgi:hypothetical protein
MFLVNQTMGWHGPQFLPCLTGQHSTKIGPQACAWTDGQARRPVRHGSQGTTGLLGPVAIGPCRPGTRPCRVGPARCPTMVGTCKANARALSYGGSGRVSTQTSRNALRPLDEMCHHPLVEPLLLQRQTKRRVK